MYMLCQVIKKGVTGIPRYAFLIKTNLILAEADSQTQTANGDVRHNHIGTYGQQEEF